MARRFPKSALSNAEDSIIGSFDFLEIFALDTLCLATRYERFERKVSNSLRRIYKKMLLLTKE